MYYTLRGVAHSFQYIADLVHMRFQMTSVALAIEGDEKAAQLDQSVYAFFPMYIYSIVICLLELFAPR